jgi:hypothetical protein
MPRPIAKAFFKDGFCVGVAGDMEEPHDRILHIRRLDKPCVRG